MHAFVLFYLGNGKISLFQFFGKLQLISLYLRYSFNCIYSQLTSDKQTRIAKPTRGSIQSKLTNARSRKHGYGGKTSPCSATTRSTIFIIGWITRRRDCTFSNKPARESRIRSPSPAKTNNAGIERAQPARPSVDPAQPTSRHDALPGPRTCPIELQPRPTHLWIYITIESREGGIGVTTRTTSSSEGILDLLTTTRRHCCKHSFSSPVHQPPTATSRTSTPAVFIRSWSIRSR